MIGFDLTGEEVWVDVSDPWELGGASNESKFHGTITALETTSGPERGALVIELDAPLKYGGSEYRRLVATSRRGSPLADDLATGARVEANLHGIPLGAVVPNPFDLSWWRGGLGMIATLTRAGGVRS